MTEKVLVEVNDSVKLYLYEGILKQNNIPYMISRPGLRSYMSIIGGGSHAVPASIVVKEADYDNAKNLTAVVDLEDDKAVNLTAVSDLEEENNRPEKSTKAYKARKTIAWIIVAFAVVPAVIMGIVELVKNITGR